MGLFSKEKESCPVCGEPLKLFKLKLRDASVCKACEGRASAADDVLKSMTLEDFRAHLAYRGECMALFDAKTPTYTFNVYDTKLYFDETNRLIFIEYDKLFSKPQPVMLRYDELRHYELKFDHKTRDSSDVEGETYLMGKAGLAVNILGTSSESNDELKFILTTANKYWPVLELKMVFSTADDNWNDITAAAQGAGRCFKAAVRGYPAEEYMKNGVCIAGKNQ